MIAVPGKAHNSFVALYEQEKRSATRSWYDDSSGKKKESLDLASIYWFAVTGGASSLEGRNKGGSLQAEWRASSRDEKSSAKATLALWGPNTLCPGARLEKLDAEFCSR